MPKADPGALDIRLTGATGAAGILLFTVSGGTIDGIDTASCDMRASLGPARDSAVAIVHGTLADGVIAHVHVPDRNVLSRYTVMVRQTADRLTYSPLATTAYHLQLVHP